MMLWKKCPQCGKTTYLEDGMDKAYCIHCGCQIGPENAEEVEFVEEVDETYTVTFHYDRGLSKKFSEVCRISFDGEEGEATEDEEMVYEVYPGKYDVTFEVDYGEDVITLTEELDVDEDLTFMIKARGPIKPRIDLKEMWYDFD